MRLALDGASTPEPLLRTPFDERNADLSPDGQWMAYDSNESGQEEVEDGQRFLVAKVGGADDPATTRHGIVVVHNWFENAAIP